MEQNLGIEQSASGSNAFTLACDAQGVHMQYASCIARMGALNAPGVKVPEDWKECGRCMTRGECRAQIMRNEEIAAGRSIYFRPRSADRPQAPAKGMTWSYKGRAAAPASAPARKSPPTVAPMVQVPTLADAITEMARREQAKTAPAPAPTPAKPEVKQVVTQPAPAPAERPPMLPGESPLAYARRIRGIN